MDHNLTFREEDDVVVVDVCGKLIDGPYSAKLRAMLRELSDAGYRNVLLNLTLVPCLDCDGLGELVAGYASLARVHGTVKLVNLTWPVRNIFQVTRLDQVFEIYEAETEAILSFYSIKPQQFEEIFCECLSSEAYLG
jgi:anti-sigma B factor antagonist